MSNQENDKIIEAALERAQEGGVDDAALCEMDIEDIFNYAENGRLPDHYHEIIYRLCKI